MSTKIYHAVKLNTNNAYTIQKIINDFSNIVKFQAPLLLAESYSSKIWFEQDMRVLGIDAINVPKINPLAANRIEFTGRWRDMKRTRQRDVDIDVDGELEITMFKDFALVFIGSERAPEHQRLLLANAHCSAEEYAYFNNTDKPRNISEEAWDQRREDWDKAYNMPSFKIEVIGPYSYDIFPKYEQLKQRTQKQWLKDSEMIAVGMLKNELDYASKIEAERIARGVDKSEVFSMIKIIGKFEAEIRTLPDFPIRVAEIMKTTQRFYTEEQLEGSK